jgi:TolA-binding protein
MGLSTRDLAEAGRRVAREQDAALERAPLLQTDQRLAAIRQRQAARVPRARSSRLAVLVLAAAIAFAAASVIVVSRRDAPLSYRIDEAAGAPGQWVGSDDGPVTLTFSEGSRIDVKTGARARVTELARAGAGLVVERGTLHVSVVPRAGNAWVIAGGPFAVHVIGTEFDIAWDPATEELAVSMLSGRVRIEGPCIEPATRIVAAPESVRLSCSSPAKADEAPASSEASAPPPPTSLPAASSAAASPPATVAATDRLETASGHELCELGSAARLAGDGAGARRYYEAARRRFPGSDAAAIAAYHLGRMAFDGQHAWADADRWFAVYLAERPGGPLAPEALGRSMESADRRGDAQRARELAERYLAAYPSGPQAGLATRLAGGSP